MSVVTRPPGQPLTRNSPPGPTSGERSTPVIGRRILLIALLAFVALPLLVEALCPLPVRFFLKGCPTDDVPLADPQTFEPILDENGWNTGYARDAARVYRDYAVVEAADPATFHVLVTDRPPTSASGPTTSTSSCAAPSSRTPPR